MKRNEWTFEYTASKLAETAGKRAAHHAERLAWWKAEKQKVAAKVSESGIDIQESVAEQGYGHSNAIFGPQIRIDSGLQRDLTECQRKIAEHADKCREYDGWLQVLNANPEARLSLEHDDYLFFFGA